MDKKKPKKRRGTTAKKTTLEAKSKKAPARKKTVASGKIKTVKGKTTKKTAKKEIKKVKVKPKKKEAAGKAKNRETKKVTIKKEEKAEKKKVVRKAEKKTSLPLGEKVEAKKVTTKPRKKIQPKEVVSPEKTAWLIPEKVLLPEKEERQALRLVPGTAAQVYNEDFTANLLKKSYTQFAREPGFWWPQFMSWATVTPDGSTGLCTTSFNASDQPWNVRHEDIRAVFPVGSHRRLSVWSKKMNPGVVTYSRPFIEFINNPTKLFRFRPTTTTDSFNVHYRIIPKISTPDDLVLFDQDVLINHVAWQLATNDGANPAQGIMLLNKFELAFNRVKNAYSDQPIELDPGANDYPGNWFEVPPP